MTARELATQFISPLRTSDTGAFALAQMEEFHVAHLPIVNEVDFLGLISDTDILAGHDLNEPLGNCTLSIQNAGIMEGQHIYDVMKIFSAMKLTVLPVLNDRNQYLGLITMAGLVSHLAGITGIDEPGGLIVLEMNDKDYTLAEIAQIVESNDTKIISMYVTSFPDSTKLEITLKVNRINIQPVLQTFFRYNYTVKASWSGEENYNDGLRDRFDALMNYLNI
jgi:acetoin utilization protein AcuB